MNLDPSLISIIAASAAPLTVIATAFTAYFNRRYDFKQKQLELYETRRLDATAAFSESFAKLHNVSQNTNSFIRDALAATYMVMPYYEEPVRERLNGLASLLRSDTGREEIYASFEECLSLISSVTTTQSKILQRVRLRISNRLRC